MAKAKPKNVVLIKDCVVREAGDGQKPADRKMLDKVRCSDTDARFLVAAGCAADPSTDEGIDDIQRAIASMPDSTPAEKKAKAAAQKAYPAPEDEAGSDE